MVYHNRGGIAVILYVFSDIIQVGLFAKCSVVIKNILGTSFVLVPVGEFEMLVDICDSGISKYLFLFGFWELRPSARYATDLRRMQSTAEDPVVLDIGSNIGYYTILAANATDADTAIAAIEPAATNRPLLRTNIRLNDLTDRVTIYRCAIGETSGQATLQLSTQSNLHRIEHQRVSDRRGGAETVKIYNLDDFLTEYGYDASQVMAVRMDLEGYEYEVLRGMEDVLNAPGPLLLYIEVHNNILSPTEAAWIPQILSASGFEISAIDRGDIVPTPGEEPKAHTWDDLADIDRAYCILAKKPAS